MSLDAKILSDRLKSSKKPDYLTITEIDMDNYLKSVEGTIEGWDEAKKILGKQALEQVREYLLKEFATLEEKGANIYRTLGPKTWREYVEKKMSARDPIISEMDKRSKTTKSNISGALDKLSEHLSVFEEMYIPTLDLEAKNNIQEVKQDLNKLEKTFFDNIIEDNLVQYNLDAYFEFQKRIHPKTATKESVLRVFEKIAETGQYELEKKTTRGKEIDYDLVRK